MPSSFDDHWINDQITTAAVSDLEDTTIAVDASYYLQLFLINAPYQEPLLPALGGLTGIQFHIEGDLDSWRANKTTPFFIFNGQSVVGSDEIAIKRGIKAIEGTDKAWSLYFQSQANEAVSAFGSHKEAYLVQNLYPLLQSILRRRGLYFKVPPVNAAAQLAYFDMVDSTQCSAIMGSQELLVYPIHDLVIRNIDWENRSFTGIQKKSIIKNLGVPESMFIDAFLMTGTSFLPRFPPLNEPNITSRQPPSVQDAVNLLRTSEKSVTNACNAFNDILSKKDPSWLQNPAEYRHLVTDQLMDFRQLAIFLVLPRMNRGIQFKPINVRVWHDNKYSHKIEYRPQDPQALKTLQQVHTWDVKQDVVKQHFPNAKLGTILFEVTALKNPEFAKATITKAKIRNIATGNLVVSVTLWRYLHLRGYINDSHQLSPWGQALAKSLEAFESTVTKHNTVPGLFEAVLLAYELLRLNLLNARNQHSELNGLPMNGSEDDKQELFMLPFPERLCS
ncbi:PIN domain-like protein [Xylaria intraflava]|nr:PIN domain-like protein [Xylaria intraflava]